MSGSKSQAKEEQMDKEKKKDSYELMEKQDELEAPSKSATTSWTWSRESGRDPAPKSAAAKFDTFGTEAACNPPVNIPSANESLCRDLAAMALDEAPEGNVKEDTKVNDHVPGSSKMVEKIEEASGGEDSGSDESDADFTPSEQWLKRGLEWEKNINAGYKKSTSAFSKGFLEETVKESAVTQKKKGGSNIPLMKREAKAQTAEAKQAEKKSILRTIVDSLRSKTKTDEPSASGQGGKPTKPEKK